MYHWSSPLDSVRKRQLPVGRRHGPRGKTKRSAKERNSSPVQFLTPGQSIPPTRLQTAAIPETVSDQAERAMAADLIDGNTAASAKLERLARVKSRGKDRFDAGKAKNSLAERNKHAVLPGIPSKDEDGNNAQSYEANEGRRPSLQSSDAPPSDALRGPSNDVGGNASNAARTMGGVDDDDPDDPRNEGGAALRRNSKDESGNAKNIARGVGVNDDDDPRTGKGVASAHRLQHVGVDGGHAYGVDVENDDFDDGYDAGDEGTSPQKVKRRVIRPPEKDVAEYLFDCWIDELTAEFLERSGFGTMTNDEWLADGVNETLGYLKSQAENYMSKADKSEYSRTFRQFTGQEEAADEEKQTSQMEKSKLLLAGVRKATKGKGSQDEGDADDDEEIAAKRGAAGGARRNGARAAVMHRAEVNTALVASTQGKINEKEIDFVLQVLEIGKRPEVNEEDFQVMSTLANEITGLQDEYRNALSDMSAMSSELQKAKEMFFVNQPDEKGEVDVADLEIALRAGRTADVDINNALASLDPHGTLRVSFISFLANLPLFVNAHVDIGNNALSTYDADDQRESMADSIAALMAAQKAAKRFTKRAVIHSRDGNKSKEAYSTFALVASKKAAGKWKKKAKQNRKK